MVSWGQLFVVVTAASMVIGKKELPKMAKYTGFYVGRSVGAVIRAKKEFFDATKDNEVVRLQREFQRGLDEINEIRAELTSVGNFRRPHEPTSFAPGGANNAGASRSTGSHSFEESKEPAQGLSSRFAEYSAAQAGSMGIAAASSADAPSSRSISKVPMTSVSSEMLGAMPRPQSESGRLALAEMQLDDKKKFFSTIDHLEGGADYVASSIVDSLLLEPQTRPMAQAPHHVPKKPNQTE